MKILLSGASGLIGSALGPVLSRSNHSVIKLVRASALGETSPAIWNPSSGQIDLGRAEEIDAVIHLAGETVAQRWTSHAKRRIRESRVDGTRLLCETIARLPRPPKAILCASATGIYGDRGDAWVDEDSSPGEGFLPAVCRDWEAATVPALDNGIRVVHLRFGVVLTARGGALKKMLPAFRFGLGGRIGDGTQFWSWVTLDDVLGAIQHALFNPSLSGPFNVVSPNPVTNGEFTEILGRVLNRSTPFPVPRAVIGLVFGEMGREALLSSFRVRPKRLLEAGYRFLFPDLEIALRHTLKER